MRDMKSTGRAFTWLFSILMSFTGQAAEIKWDGEGGDGLWMNPLNWRGNTLPGTSDKVLLDNSFVTGSYEVSLGPGNSQVAILALEIRPVAGSIQFVIPLDNTAVPAINCSGEVYGLVLNPGAIFINASGASSGATVLVADSIRVNNGGKYVHQTPRSHADNVRSLSRATGTEEGEFEFKIPVASSTISVSGQVFGKLRLTPGQNGVINYTGTGTSSLRIRSDLLISSGVNLSFNLEGFTEIGRHLVQDGGTMNLGSTARNMTLVVQGNIVQSAGATITETGTGQPVVVLGGWQEQQLSLQGSVVNEVMLKVNNPAGVVIHHMPELPYKLSLESGVVNTGENVLVLGENCTLGLPADLKSSYINGQLRKRGLGLADFLFPVGSNNAVRWLTLKSATGDFTVKHVQANPKTLSNQHAEGIAHISGLEYWLVTSNGANGDAAMELSFDNVNSGGVTDLAQLRVACLEAGEWVNLGNSTTSGSAGSAGSVSSEPVVEWTTGIARHFTLASSNANQNPLPLVWQHLIALGKARSNILQWKVEPGTATYFQLERSVNGDRFHLLATVEAVARQSDYQYEDLSVTARATAYRIIIVKPDSTRLVSKMVTVHSPSNLPDNITLFADVNGVRLRFPQAIPQTYQVQVYDITGKLISSTRLPVSASQVSAALPLALWRFKPVIIVITDKMGNRMAQKVVVQ